MLKKERQALIIRQINIHNKVMSADLSELLQVSEDTIRRDLHELDEEGKILKVHGGALSKSYHTVIEQGEVYAYEEKSLIAQKAISLMRDGMFILTSGGTTISTIARQLPNTLKATFFTVSPIIAMELNEHPNIEVILLGGKISKETQICMGGEVVNRLQDIKIDLCLVGTNGIDSHFGTTEPDPEIVPLKRAMRKVSDKLAVVAISEKLGTTQRMKVFGLEEIDYLITELPSTAPQLESYQRNGLVLL